MNKPLISIIIPIYNKEKYIGDCLDSIIEQKLDSIEIICVDDGSHDNSKIICERYLSDKRVKYFYKSNGGLCSARNFGIHKASGKYIHFVDADDLVNRNCYQFLVDIIKKYKSIDLIMFYPFFFKATDKLPKMEKNGNYVNKYGEKEYVELNLNDDIEFIVSDEGGGQAVWIKLFNRELILKHSVFFDEKIIFNEDLEYFYRYIQHCSDVLSLPYYFYFYRTNTGGMMDTLINKKNVYASIFNAYNNSKNFFLNKNERFALVFTKAILKTAFNNYLLITDYEARLQANFDLNKFINNNNDNKVINELVSKYYSSQYKLLIFNKKCLISNIDYDLERESFFNSKSYKFCKFFRKPFLLIKKILNIK